MNALWTFLQLHGTDILDAATKIVSAASIIANFTKTDADNKAVGLFSKLVNFLAANFFTLKIEPPKVNT